MDKLINGTRAYDIYDFVVLEKGKLKGVKTGIKISVKYDMEFM